MIRGAKTFFGVTVGILATGCGGSLALALDEMTLQEAEELAAATMFATFDVTSVVPPRPSGLPTEGQPRIGWAVDFEAEVRCPAGGRVALAVDAAVRDQGGAREVDYRLTQVHDACGVDDTAAERVTVSGAPRSTARVRVAHDEAGRVAWDGHAEGELVWAKGERSGRCAFDVTFTAHETTAVATASVVGSVCGQSLRQVLSLH